MLNNDIDDVKIRLYNFNTGNNHYKVKFSFKYSNSFLIIGHSRNYTYAGIFSVKSVFTENVIAYEWLGNNKPSVSSELIDANSMYLIIDFGSSNNYSLGTIICYRNQISSIEYP